MLPLSFRSIPKNSLFQNRVTLKFLHRFSAALLVLLAFTFVQTSSAQTAVYGSVMYDRFGFDGSNYHGVSYKTANAGVIGGAFYTFRSSSRFKAGLDGRITYGPGYNGGSAYTGAFRVSFVPNHNPLRPYFQLGGGVVSTQLAETTCDGFSCGTTNNRITNGALQLAFGLDIRATPHVDIRAFDYGADADGSNGPTRAAAGFLDAGIVYHFR